MILVTNTRFGELRECAEVERGLRKAGLRLLKVRSQSVWAAAGLLPTCQPWSWTNDSAVPSLCFHICKMSQDYCRLDAAILVPGETAM